MIQGIRAASEEADILISGPTSSRSTAQSTSMSLTSPEIIAAFQAEYVIYMYFMARQLSLFICSNAALFTGYSMAGKCQMYGKG